MASVKVFIDKRSSKLKTRGVAPLKFQIMHKSTNACINLNVNIPPRYWDGTKILRGCPDIPDIQFTNNQIIEERLRLQSFISSLQISGRLEFCDAKRIKDLFLQQRNGKAFSSNFLSYFEEQKDCRSKRNRRTGEIYKATLNKLHDYTNGNLFFEDITAVWLRNFDDWMSCLNLSINARSIHLRNIRSVFNDAISDDRLPQVDYANYPFRQFKIRKEKTTPRALIRMQLRALLELQSLTERQEMVRDFFMLSFYLIGINIKDLLLLEQINNKGRIVYRRAKTGRLYSIKVQPEAKAIIDKYRGEQLLLKWGEHYKEYRSVTKLVNSELKNLGALIEAPELTSYYARHTWATFAAKLDIPKETIAAALGHGQDSITDIYIDFDEKKIDTANREVIDYLIN